MAAITVEDILEATGGELLSGNSRVFNGVSIDSRTVAEGSLFIAIRGEKFDGHDFLEGALEISSGAIVDTRPEPLPAGKVIVSVGDTLRSLQDIAHFLRTGRDVPVVAVTGSNGKTTTKEMIHSILSKRFKTLKNEGNLNNLIGLPLSMTRMEPDDEVIVLEMGMNASGEIRRLCEIAVPSHGVITNVGSAHIGRLGSYEAVRAAKLELLEGLNVAVVNADDDYLMDGLKQIRQFKGQVITFAVHGSADVMAGNVHATDSGSDFTLGIKDRGSASVSLNVHGMFNVYNALAAAAVSSSLGIEIDEIKAALETHRAFPMRFEIIRKEGLTVINDSYNANPSSMEESVKELVRLGAGGRVVAVLGDMAELDEFSGNEHRAVGRMMSGAGVDVFIAVGDKMKLAAEECGKTGPEVHVFIDAEEAKKNITGILKKGDTVLIKGSRAMSMEKVIEGAGHAL